MSHRPAQFRHNTIFTMSTETKQNPLIERMFAAGAHYGFTKARRHPSTKDFIFGVKNRVEIFDLEKTSASLEDAKRFVRELASRRKQLLFVSSKHEARAALVQGAESINQPYVAGRWVGGTLTNYGNIRKRVATYEDLKQQREKGELGKYTKREKLLIDREIANLEDKFGGIVEMRDFPGALFVIDPKKEHIAVTEAHKKGIPVIALANSDCNLREVTKAIPGNDVSTTSVKFFIDEIVSAYREGQMSTPGAEESKS